MKCFRGINKIYFVNTLSEQEGVFFMFKKAVTLFLASLVIFVFCIINNQPVFKGRAKQFQVYVQDSISSQILTVDEYEYCFLSGVKGLSFTVHTIDLAGFLHDYNAKILFTEQLEQGTCYYAYSPKIKYKQEVNKKVVNLQIFVGEQRVVVGSPLIYGSF